MGDQAGRERLGDLPVQREATVGDAQTRRQGTCLQGPAEVVHRHGVGRRAFPEDHHTLLPVGGQTHHTHLVTAAVRRGGDHQQG